MQINLATIEQHATEKLRRIEKQPATADRLGALKKFLKSETQRLQLRHRFGISGSQIVAARSLVVDLLIQRIAQQAAAEKLGGKDEAANFAIIALGGYGRRELSPQSDIDVMFLYKGRRDADHAAKLSEAMLYSLWDVGFNVGHSVRSMAECLSAAKEDIVSRNSMIEARLLWGCKELFEELTERLDDEIFSKKKRELLNELSAERLSRYGKFGDAACSQEPNVKETAGGLRDLHELFWVSRVTHGATTVSQLVECGAMAERDGKAINAAYDFLLRVRNEIHFLTNRKSDLLSLDLQQQIARNLRYEDTKQQQASELFMRDYYLHARRLHRLTESYLQRATQKQEKKSWFSRARSFAAEGGFVMRDGELDLAERDGKLSGQRLMLAFGYAQATSARLSSQLQEVLQDSLSNVNKTFRSAPEARESFLKMLRVKGRVAIGLRLMHDLEFLGKYLPEIARVTCMPQHDLYHRFTVDEHTLRTIEALDELANSRSKAEERYRGVYDQINDLAVLHLGLLMHDIGKGLGGGHTEKGVTIAKGLCARLQIEEKMAEQVVFLVQQHLTMSHIAQRRDLSDEKVIQDFAAQMGTIENLNLLCMLTYGDIHGVGPGMWNEWKDALIWELYQKARIALTPEAEADIATEPLRLRIARMLGSEVDSDEVRRHFKLLPDDYARVIPAQTVIEHIRLASTLNSRVVKTGWRVNLQSRCTDLHLAARNRRGLFAAVAGTLTAQGVNILSVHLNTRADGVAVDTFKVRDAVGEPINDPARWEQIDLALKRAISGEADVAVAVDKRLRAQTSSRFSSRRKTQKTTPTRFSWDNYSSNKSTILEVMTADQLGLAYKIASTLAALDLDIVFAKVATEKNLALDIFYVTNAAGEKLTDEALPTIEDAIRLALN
ncbi:MAG: [protein-PII] uridylyltransferase [Blastocatellia bacterium]